MIGQYLSNNNETATVAFRQKNYQLNSRDHESGQRGARAVCTTLWALFRFQNSHLNSTMQKEDSSSHQNIGKCMKY
jgi:hypothetical protein